MDTPLSLLPKQYRTDLAYFIASGLDALSGLEEFPVERSRELSLVRTKLEEAAMWFERIPTKGTA